MVEPESRWILPENLRAQEAKEREAAGRGAAPASGDFGAYHAYATGADKTLIRAHALSEDADADAYAAGLRRVLARRGLAMSGRVLDAGCAIGTVTDALRRAGFAAALGVDLSRDAIDVARQRYPSSSFLCVSADELGEVADGSLDAVHAREFYPFTRTKDAAYQRRYLELFHRKLRPGGWLAAYMKAEGGLHLNFTALREGGPFPRAEAVGAVPLKAAKALGGLLDGPVYGLVESAATAGLALGVTRSVWHLFLK